MDGHVAMSLLKPAVLAHVVQVVSADDDRTLHLHLHDDAGEDAAANAHVASERTLLVDVRPFDRLRHAANVSHQDISHVLDNDSTTWTLFFTK